MKAMYPSSLNQPKRLRAIRWSRWMVGILLAILVHLLILLKPDLLFPPSQPPPRVDLTDISPEKLDAIRKQWKERPLLLNTQTTPADPNAPIPKNARYDSDRNREVPKESRARVTNVIPKPGTAVGEDFAKKGGAEDRKKTIALKNLSNFSLKPEDSPSLRKTMEKQKQESQEAQERGHTAQGGDQALLDKDLPEGDQNILNTQESKYYSFYSRIYETLGPLWQSIMRQTVSHQSFHAGEYTTRAEIILDSDGNYIETKIVESSGSSALDHVVDLAWRKVPRVPNPPRDLLDSTGHIHMGWSFRVMLDQSTGGIQYAPPSREY